MLSDSASYFDWSCKKLYDPDAISNIMIISLIVQQPELALKGKYVENLNT